jgi:hypothetical protein
VREGRCILKVINGTETDALVRVMRVDTGEQLYRNFYILETTRRELTADGYVDRTKFSEVTLTLHKVINGNFHSSPISEAEFWRETQK